MAALSFRWYSFAKGGQAGGAHPNLEGLPSLQIRRRVLLRVPIRIGQSPVRRRDDVGNVGLGRPIEVLVAVPCDSRSGHGVGPRFVALGVWRILQNWAGEGVVEHGVGNEPARVVRLLDAVAVGAIQRGALGAGDVGVRPDITLELLEIARLGVPTVVLGRSW